MAKKVDDFMDKFENGLGKYIDDYKIQNEINKSYKLSNHTFFHFHNTDEGFDYSIYDKNGILVDGGVLEYDMTKIITTAQILKELSHFTNTPELLNDKKKIDNSIIENFEIKI